MNTPHRLQAIKTFPALVKYLRDELDWKIETEDFEDLTFDFSAEELGIDAKTAAKIREIKQLRPLTSNQTWGIFFVVFEPKRLPVVALRKILGKLVVKKRASANKSERAAWNLHDLLFISAFGENHQRELTLAHFSEGHAKDDIPTLKVLGWDELDTELKLQHLDKALHERLRWPSNPEDMDTWRKQWSSAFTLRHREVINTAKDLAARLAVLARGIRARAGLVLEIESDKGPLRKLYLAFQTALIHDLSEDDFADMYAQTITYGLFSAAVSRTAPDAGTVVLPENLADMVPITNPFLKEMLATFITAGGRKGKLDFDELGVQEVVEVLNSKDTNLNAVLRDFGNRGYGEDPVIHFYEDFLHAYDKRRKVQRGVFYTPQPVVSYIVRSVHELLRTEFGLEDGLASTVTWGEIAKQHKNLKLPQGTAADTPFVTILDPATGTATFLVEAIDVIRHTMIEKWRKANFSKKQIDAAWNEYVPKHLLPRLYGYELMMAPYAIAHMKIGLKLGEEPRYTFHSRERARIYLTNALEPATDANQQREFQEWAPALAHEAQGVNVVKRSQRFTVVIGNPPYAGNSSNRGEWIENLISDYRKVDGKPLGEVKVWLKDDYVKFVRFGEKVLEEASVGVLGYITNNSFFDGLTFRGMRHHILSNCTYGCFLNLHGNGNLKELAPDGSTDENVFDILQGVGITLLVRRDSKPHAPSAFSADLFGTREAKYARLNTDPAAPRNFIELKPKTPNYFVVPRGEEHDAEYEQFTPIPELFVVGGLGFQSHRDSFVVAFSSDELTKRMKAFFDLNLPDKQVKERFEIDDYRRFVVAQFRRANQFQKSCVRRLQYRPFDYRYIYYARDIVQEWQIRIHGHLLKSNLGLNVMRQTKAPTWQHVMVSQTPTPAVFVEIKDGSSQFPLYCYSGVDGPLFAAKGDRVPNLGERVISTWFGRMGVLPTWLSQKSNTAAKATPEDIFHYTYAVLHCPSYRSRYGESLKIDFPRLPLSGNLDLFRALAKLGEDLVALHLLESAKLNNPITTYAGPANPEVEKVGYSDDTVWLDKARTRGFRGLNEEIWTFYIGGYQVCEKWLKDRKGRTLSAEDIAHYHRIVVALHETIRLMQEIDEVIDHHGGWPSAFVPNSAKSATK